MGGFDDYALADTPAVGPTGAVSWARHLPTGEAVAVTALTPAAAADQAFLGRLRATAATLAKVSHANVLPIREVVEGSGRVWVVEGWVEGRELGEVVADGRLTAEQSVTLASGVLRGLAAVHGRGVVHGDISPASIVVAAGGMPLLVGFGFAGLPGRGPADAAGDLLAVATVLRDLLAGGARHGKLEAVVAQATSSRPKDRYKDANAFLRAVEKAARSDFGKGWAATPSLATRAVAPPARPATEDLVAPPLVVPEVEPVSPVAAPPDDGADEAIAPDESVVPDGAAGSDDDVAPPDEERDPDGEAAPDDAAASSGIAPPDDAVVRGEAPDDEVAPDDAGDPSGTVPPGDAIARDEAVGPDADSSDGPDAAAADGAAPDHANSPDEGASPGPAPAPAPADDDAHAAADDDAHTADADDADDASATATATDDDTHADADADAHADDAATGLPDEAAEVAGLVEPTEPSVLDESGPPDEPDDAAASPVIAAPDGATAAEEAAVPAPAAPDQAAGTDETPPDGGAAARDAAVPEPSVTPAKPTVGAAAKKPHQQRSRGKKRRATPAPTAPPTVVPAPPTPTPTSTTPPPTPTPTVPPAKGGGRRPQPRAVVRSLAGLVMILLGLGIAVAVDRQPTDTTIESADPQGPSTTAADAPLTAEGPTPAEIAGADIIGAWRMRLAVFESTGFFGAQIGKSEERIYTIRSDCSATPCTLKLNVVDPPQEFDLRRQAEEYVVSVSGTQDCIILSTGQLLVPKAGVASVTVHLRPTSAARAPSGGWRATGLTGSVALTFDTSHPDCTPGSGAQRSSAVGTRQ